MLTDAFRRVTSIDEVIAALQAIDGALPDHDGLKWFNFLYLRVTEAVRDDRAGWQDRDYLERFDVEFARLYFEALAQQERDPALVPPAWRPLFERRTDARLARVQFAMAGMNAHINRDLAVALRRIADTDGFARARQRPPRRLRARQHRARTRRSRVPPATVRRPDRHA